VLRNRLGLSQAEFAKEVGVAPNTIARWERGELNMRPAMEMSIKRLCKDTDLTTGRK
jgi:DNA-binding XRE family transcriptional regulator